MERLLRESFSPGIHVVQDGYRHDPDGGGRGVRAISEGVDQGDRYSLTVSRDLTII